MEAALGLPALVALIAIALFFDALNCRQLDCDRRLDKGASAAIRGGLGGVLQLHRLPVLPGSMLRRRSEPELFLLTWSAT
jgi:hypothetical protein